MHVDRELKQRQRRRQRERHKFTYLVDKKQREIAKFEVL